MPLRSNIPQKVIKFNKVSCFGRCLPLLKNLYISKFAYFFLLCFNNSAKYTVHRYATKANSYIITKMHMILLGSTTNDVKHFFSVLGKTA